MRHSRRRSLHDHHLRIFRLAQDAQRNGPHGINLFRFAAVRMIPPGSQLNPFYLLERKATTHDEPGCKRSAWGKRRSAVSLYCQRVTLDGVAKGTAMSNR